MFNWQSPSQSVFDSEGRIQPLNCKKGELANRIITVGDPNRALKFSKFLDQDTPVTIRHSNMIFCTYTGTYKGVPVSIIATGMGFAMAELMLVQARAVVDGPLYVVRFGTCGSLHADVPVGCYAVSNEAYFVRQNFDNEEFPFDIAKKPIPFDAGLRDLICEEFKKHPEYRTVVGPDTSADTFYASQGRVDDNFDNRNGEVISTILKQNPEALSFEMESYLLAFLASLPNSNMKTAAICLTLAQRTSGDFLPNEKKYEMELFAGQTLLDVLAKCK